MKILLVMLVCLAGSMRVSGQAGQATIEVTKLNKACIFSKSRVLIAVQVTGTLPTADSAWRLYLEKNLKTSIVIPGDANEGKYTAVVVYIISKDGSLSDIACRNDPGYGICEAATRIIMKFKTWGPGKWYPVSQPRH